MARAKKNERCPFQPTCERACIFINNELECNFYKNNAHPGMELEDQEELREIRKKAEESKSKTVYASPEQNNIVMIPRVDLFTHPDNPRDDLGDLTELAESIKQNGIMQNLTVVPRRAGGYTVIIGHRRLAAAQIAQLKALPCIITEMSDRKQHETMLAENMLRKDLTLANQVQAFEQLRLDGATAEEIAETSGFSLKTVEKRLKYAEKIGVEALNNIEKSGKQVTLEDFDRVCSFEQPEIREKVLEHIGTNNFQWECSSAEREIKAKETDKDLLTVLEGLRAKPIDRTEADYGYDHSTRKFLDKEKFLKDVETAIEGIPDDTPLYYHDPAETGSWFYLCVGEPIKEVKSAEEEKKEEDDKRREEQERTKQLEELFDKMFESRWFFINNMISDDIKNKQKDVVEFITWMTMNCDLYNDDLDDLAKMFDAPEQGEDEETDEFTERIVEFVSASSFRKPEAALICVLKLMYVQYGDSGYCPFYRPIYQAGRLQDLEVLYNYLKRFGYEMSDEEINLINGTHPVYLYEDEN